jgi:hypothetical protein
MLIESAVGSFNNNFQKTSAEDTPTEEAVG